MNNIRKIIEQRLENAKNDFLNALKNGNSTDREIGELQYTVATYQDCLNLIPEDLGELSDGYHTFNSLYEQRMYLFATLVNLNRHKSWKSYKHEDGELCFGGGWFIVGIDTPKGTYTYHYENKYWHLFDCQELECSKKWDGHTDKDIARVLSLTDPRTEQDILNDFEKSGYETYSNPSFIMLENYNKNKMISVVRKKKEYEVIAIENNSNDIYHASQPLTMQEHKLLNELFEVIFDDK